MPGLQACSDPPEMERNLTFSLGQIEGIWTPNFIVGERAWFVILEVSVKLPVNFPENSFVDWFGGGWGW